MVTKELQARHLSTRLAVVEYGPRRREARKIAEYIRAEGRVTVRVRMPDGSVERRSWPEREKVRVTEADS